MKRTPAEDLAKFNESVSILVKAYLNDTLAHRVCAACAVGNLIAGTIKADIKKSRGIFGQTEYDWIRNGQYITVGWDEVFCTMDGETQNVNHKKYVGQIRKQIDVTGYTWRELAKIEFAFETCEIPDGCNPEIDETHEGWMFNGLMAVVDVLASIHSIDLDTTEAARKLFVKV